MLLKAVILQAAAAVAARVALVLAVALRAAAVLVLAMLTRLKVVKMKRTLRRRFRRHPRRRWLLL